MNVNLQKRDIPLHLCQVLEEEFENLHGPLDGDGKTEDGNYGEVVRQDWGFHRGHFGAALAESLQNARTAWRKAHPNLERPGEAELKQENDLYTFLAFRYLPDDEKTMSGGEQADFLSILRRILQDMDKEGKPNGAEWTIYKRARFEHLTLRDETRGLMEIGWPDGGEMAFDGAQWAEGDEARFIKSDLARFRRLMLEDAFPDAIKKVYDLRVNRAIQLIHGLEKKRSALCFSGGGIRSGTFALGIIQSLAKRRLLGEFDYLSTVSGGGYIGGWLTAWIHRHPKGLDGVIADMNGETRASKLEPEPEPLRHLRDYSSFITPRTGILSADSWTFIVIYIRNLLLNWVVLIPLFASVLMIPRVAIAVVIATPSWRLLAGLLALGTLGILLLKPSLRKLRGKQALLLGGGFIILLAIVLLSAYISRTGWGSALASVGWNAPSALLVAGTILGAYAMAYMRLNRPSNSGVALPGNVWARHRDQNSFIWMCLLPLSISATLLTTFWAWFRHQAHNAESLRVYFLGKRFSELVGFPEGFPELASFLIYGALLGITGWLLYLILARSLKGALRELGVTLFASIIGSLLLYAVAVNIDVFYAPVTNAFYTFPDGSVASVPQPYNEWWYAEMYACLAFPVYLLIFFLGITLFVGLTSRRSERSPKERRGRYDDKGGEQKAGGSRIEFDKSYIEDEDREWLARASGWLFIAAIGWLFFSVLVIFGPLLLFALGKWLAAAGGISGLISILGGRSASTPGQSKKDGKQGLLASLGVNVIVVASFVFFACLVVLVSLLTGTVIAWLAKYLPTLLTGPQTALFKGQYPFTNPENVFRVTHFPMWLYLFVLALALQILGQGASLIINLNKFSLHAGYRDRIIRAFLGASRLKGERRENPFTGFDPRDNLYMEELRPWTLRESDFKEPNGLAAFVAALHQTGDAEGPTKAANPDDAKRPAVARYLRTRIDQIEGESRKYFEDPSASINTNPSFRSALFGDLSRILQVSAMDKAEEFGQYLEDAVKDYHALAPSRGATDYRILLNRLLLLRAFPDSLKYPPRLYGLMHVVNMALNLVGGDRLAWQQRRAESFTSTPLHSGSLFVGYRRTCDYGGKNGISLGTAIATSGAAANSNMGYFSPSPFVTLVLTFFNARLGWWLGNPGVNGADTYFRSHPQKALSPILDEAFGLTDDTNPYVLLSDGGHFENLALYEMVLRRCRNIVVIDGSADPEGTLEGLGDAVRKIRIDMGVPIEFKAPFPILPRPESETPEHKKSGGYCAVGDIHYEAVDAPGDGDAPATNCTHGRHKLTGRLVYIKPTIYGSEPRDIFNYARSHPTFPHESTADQFFDEPQFESHRMLGYYILEQLCEEARTSPDGDPCESRDLQKFIDWLDTRAETARQKGEDDEKK